MADIKDSFVNDLAPNSSVADRCANWDDIPYFVKVDMENHRYNHNIDNINEGSAPYTIVAPDGKKYVDVTMVSNDNIEYGDDDILVGYHALELLHEKPSGMPESDWQKYNDGIHQKYQESLKDCFNSGRSNDLSNSLMAAVHAAQADPKEIVAKQSASVAQTVFADLKTPQVESEVQNDSPEF